MSKKYRIWLECKQCDFEVEYKLKKNKRGFFEIPIGYCPNDFSLLSSAISSEEKYSENKQ